MRGDNIVDLIKYHYENNDQKFEEITEQIISDEQQKGNIKLAEKILNVYKKLPPKKIENEKFLEHRESYSYGPSSGLVMKDNSKVSNKFISPKDKSSNNDLFEIIDPGKFISEELILSEGIQMKLEEITLEYKNREILRTLNLKSENRLLLCGPPGCGKTTTAYFISYILNLPLAYVRLDALITSLLGQTGTNLRKIFDSVNNQEIVLFLDEFDAIAKKREDNNELGELKRVVNTLLQNIDLLPDNVFLVAATNHEDLLDRAVWRRFNTVMYLDLPDNDLREAYIRQLLLKYKNHLKLDVDEAKIAKLCKGFSFADIQEVLNKAIKKCLIHNKKEKITTKDLIESLNNKIFLYNKKGNIDLEKIKELRERGLNLREISEITSIARSTLSDWLNK
ncbi:AAA family ATPase [Lysinibacillus sphaericus]|uniref:ATPase central domain-containing protein n=1 Tax=Lysinibacillus sphaericus OT4b.31 TaxID=1285586 RepID=R7Z9Z6_LYSSH|nr:AAA family ATPase [Lysinibacillus sphaericus]EON70938.1 ATPase central domain-containing protein [Lysinibacillus sphaericus OT4b.31]